ncbi:DUF1102 family protein (plasmid) [Halalkaliarchaeum sp. AArc-CO]|uniref:hypothetical protein n=1 Tax=Halalkaliarchaeum sp. AArc-CO TaxID=2866381 RepID=UPI00217D0A66|nr:hypothetical protein [Halalkaliarchaeum sp. AArc-CO]UWG49267.1 DUF1102 family protein [Halalkaliarchaeum sp. AArc-CO]
MKRRQILAGVVATVGASVFATGTGAFSKATVQREITVEITNDLDAVLTLTPLGGSQRSSGGFPEEGTVEFNLPGDVSEKKLNIDAIIQYSRDVEPEGANGLLRIGNDGTETVEVTDDPVDPDPDKPGIGLFWVEEDRGVEGLKPLLREEPVTLEPGDHIDVGVEVDTFGLDPNETYETEVTINADQI